MPGKPTIPRTCEHCGADFTAWPVHIRNGRGRFCSSACYHTARITFVDRTCGHCGAIFQTKPSQVRAGNAHFCSVRCARSHYKTSLSHGESSPGRRSPEYAAWCSMKSRCLNDKHRAYVSYGGRGIGVCARWQESFEAFLSDVGRRPSPVHSIDRINNDGHYEPSNVRWAPSSEQAKNRRRSPKRCEDGH